VTERLQVFGGGLGDLLSGGVEEQQATQGLGETALAAFEFWEEGVKHLAEAILQAGEFLGELMVEKGQVAQGCRGLSWTGQAAFLPGGEEPGRQSLSINAVSFGFAQRTAATKVTRLERRDEVDGMGQGVQMVQVQSRVRPGRLQAHVPFGRRLRLPEPQKGLPTGLVRRKRLGVEGMLLPIIPQPQKSSGEGIFADVQTEKTQHLAPPRVRFGVKGRPWSVPSLQCPCSRLIGALRSPINSLGMWEAGKGLLEGLVAQENDVSPASPSTSLLF